MLSFLLTCCLGANPHGRAAYKGFSDCIRLLLYMDAYLGRADKEGMMLICIWSSLFLVCWISFCLLVVGCPCVLSIIILSKFAMWGSLWFWLVQFGSNLGIPQVLLASFCMLLSRQVAVESLKVLDTDWILKSLFSVEFLLVIWHACVCLHRC